MKPIHVSIVVSLLILFTSSFYTVHLLSTSIKLQAQIRDTQWEQDSIYNKGTKPRDYQLDVTQDSVYMYDGNRLVGVFKLDYDNDPCSTMILEDNQ